MLGDVEDPDRGISTLPLGIIKTKQSVFVVAFVEICARSAYSRSKAIYLPNTQHEDLFLC